MLGVLPGMVGGKEVLEVGPGCGYNSLYTASLRPNVYDMVEGNPTGVEQISETFSAFPELGKNLRIYSATLDKFTSSTKKQYDVVLCEGVLGGFAKPKRALKQLFPFTAPSGLLVVTTIDSVSTLAENVRRLCSYMCLDMGADKQTQVKTLLPLLSPHLLSLQGMSRRHDDWIIDNILLPTTAGYSLLPISDVIEILPKHFEFFSSSPRFSQEFRWYKDIVGAEYSGRNHALASYWENLHNFLDHSLRFSPREAKTNMELSSYCNDFRNCVVEFERSGEYGAVREAAKVLLKICKCTSTFSPKTTKALAEAGRFLNAKKVRSNGLRTMKYFRSLFGRTMQYVSLINRGPLIVPVRKKRKSKL